MKASEIRELSPDEIQGKVVDLKEELLNLRFQHGIGQLENPQKIKQARRVLARMKTIIKENEINKAD
jgi:large subunit ribosomal protein L29